MQTKTALDKVKQQGRLYARLLHLGEKPELSSNATPMKH